MKFKKKFLTKERAKAEMYAFRRNGFDAWARGAVCTVVIINVSTVAEKLAVFGHAWKICS